MSFWAIILSPDVLASQSRALKTLFRVTNPKKTWAKKIHIGLAPRARQRRQKCANMLSLWRNTQRIQNPSRKKIFFNFKLKACRIWWGFDQLSSSIGQQVMIGQSLGHYSGFALLKGLSMYQWIIFSKIITYLLVNVFLLFSSYFLS